jgi:hypothetical protein
VQRMHKKRGRIRRIPLKINPFCIGTKAAIMAKTAKWLCSRGTRRRNRRPHPTSSVQRTDKPVGLARPGPERRWDMLGTFMIAFAVLSLVAVSTQVVAYALSKR